MSSTVSLVVTAGPIRGQRYDFPEHDTFLFGRAPECHARLASSDTSASRHHFLLEVNPPVARLRDLGSLNGTWVNSTRYGGRGALTPEEAAQQRWPEVDLADGDSIRVGATVFAVRIEGDAHLETGPLEDLLRKGPAHLPPASVGGFDVGLPARPRRHGRRLQGAPPLRRRPAWR